MILTNEREVEVNLLRPLFVDTLGYAEEDLEWAKPVPMQLGRKRLVKEADLVVSHKGKPVITVEAKSPTEAVTAYFGQVDSYAFHLRTPFSVITNGRRFVVRGYYSFNSRINVIDEDVRSLEDDQWNKVRKLLARANITASIGEKAAPVAAPDPVKIKDYRRFFRRLHNGIRDLDKLDPAAAFDELSKILFLKAAEDEWRLRNDSRPVLTPDKIRDWSSLGNSGAVRIINEWFQAATSELFPGVFDDHPRINLSPNTLAWVLEQADGFHIKGGELDVKGRAFEEFLPSQMRGKGLGQFFTPRPIVDFMAAMSRVSIHDIVADFACGSGGFLIKAFEEMEHAVEQLPPGTLQRMESSREELLNEIRNHQIFGIDAEPRAARTAKMNMLLWGDGRKVVRGNGLDLKDYSERQYELEPYDSKNQGSGCTLILANPPFGSSEKEQHILKRYELGSKFKMKSSEKTEILFIERGLDLLRPGGRMLIVLPQGLMSGSSNARVRDHIHSRAEVRAVVSLPTHTFVQSGVPTVNTCVVYLHKFTDEKKSLYDDLTKGLSQQEIRELIRTRPEFDYGIFMGSAEFIGYEPSGRSIVASGEKTDLDLLLEDFLSGAEEDRPDVDLFEFARRHYGDKSIRRRDQKVRGTERGLKTSFTMRLKDTEERLDPPYYIFKAQAGGMLSEMMPVNGAVQELKTRFKPRNEDDLDAELPFASVASDGIISLDTFMRGDEISASYKPKLVTGGDFVYNPMRINVGSIGIVPHDVEVAITSPDYVVFRLSGWDEQFFLNLMRTPFYKMYIDVVATGSIRDRLYFTELQGLRVPEVSMRDQLVIADALDRIDAELQKSLRALSEAKALAVEEIHDFIAAEASEDTSDLKAAFRKFAERWRRETALVSSSTARTQNRWYKKIIELGPAVVPMIIDELRERPDLWFDALEELTGTSPVPESSRDSVLKSAQAWIDWSETSSRQHA